MKRFYKVQLHVIPEYGDPYWMGAGSGLLESPEEAEAAALKSIELNEHFNIDKYRILSMPIDWDVVKEQEV